MPQIGVDSAADVLVVIVEVDEDGVDYVVESGLREFNVSE
jgi:hypothetical protein